MIWGEQKLQLLCYVTAYVGQTVLEELDRLRVWGWKEGKSCPSTHICLFANLCTMACDGITVCSSQLGNVAAFLSTSQSVLNRSSSVACVFPCALAEAIFATKVWIMDTFVLSVFCVCVYCTVGVTCLFYFIIFRWFCVCLLLAMSFAPELVDSQPWSNVPPLTGSIRGPLTHCSPWATGSSKRLKASQ